MQNILCKTRNLEAFWSGESSIGRVKPKKGVPHGPKNSETVGQFAFVIHVALELSEYIRTGLPAFFLIGST
jgi:hypothetical protein